MLAMGSTTFLLKLPINLPNLTSGVQFGRINRNWIVLKSATRHKDHVAATLTSKRPRINTAV
jgi:hypothetical protein